VTIAANGGQAGQQDGGLVFRCEPDGFEAGIVGRCWGGSTGVTVSNCGSTRYQTSRATPRSTPPDHQEPLGSVLSRGGRTNCVVQESSHVGDLIGSRIDIDTEASSESTVDDAD